MADRPADAYALDKRRLRASFERAAGSYDRVAVLQREIADRLIERLDVVRLAPRVVLDAGCGTGYGTRLLARRYPRARLVALDLASAMATHARQRVHGWPSLLARLGAPRDFLCADIERLPLANASVDLIVSNLALQWCDPVAATAELRRVLRPDGLLMFTTFGPDTLRELRAAWQSVDDTPHVHGFLDMHDLGDLLVRSGFVEPVLDVDRLTVTYEDAREVMRDLKALGAHNAALGRARGLTGKQRFARFIAAYEAQRRDGRIPATHEVVYGHAWAGEPKPASLSGTIAIPVEQLRRPRR
jgi:malonyl-CoA O-methyltransferase